VFWMSTRLLVAEGEKEGFHVEAEPRARGAFIETGLAHQGEGLGRRAGGGIPIRPRARSTLSVTLVRGSEVVVHVWCQQIRLDLIGAGVIEKWIDRLWQTAR